MIEVSELSKRYGSVVAIDQLSFGVASGEVVGFLGPNGAGKSTTLRILSGCLGASRGRVRIGGFDIAEQPVAARRLLGYMPELAPSYPEMRVREYLQFRAALKGIRRPARTSSVEAATRMSGVSDVGERLIGELSRGYRQRVGLADALLGRPPLLILDEPTAGLDPNQIREVRALIRELGGHHTVLLSTHILSEVESVCDRVLVIDRGRLVAQGTLSDLKRTHSAPSLELVVSTSSAGSAVDKLAESAPDASPLRGARWRLVFADGEREAYQIVLRGPLERAEVTRATNALIELIVTHHIELISIAVQESSLEEVFARLTTDEAGQPRSPDGGARTESSADHER